MATQQSNLPTIQRLKYEDYARAENWQGAMQLLVNALNLFMTPVYDILNGGIGYTNLVAPQVYTTTITAKTTTTFSFVNPMRTLPQSVVIGNCWSGLPSTHPAVALQVYWHYSGNTVLIDNIVGLTAGTEYTVTLVIS